MIRRGAWPCDQIDVTVGQLRRRVSIPDCERHPPIRGAAIKIEEPAKGDQPGEQADEQQAGHRDEDDETPGAGRSARARWSRASGPGK